MFIQWLHNLSSNQEWMSMPNPDLENPIPTSLRSTVLCTGGRILHFFAPSSAQIAIFFIFPELCIFLLRRGAWWGGPLGFLMAGAPYLTLKLWPTFLKSHEVLKPRGTWPQTTPTRRTIFWGPCLALARFGCSRSTSICRSSRCSIKLLQKEFITIK